MEITWTSEEKLIIIHNYENELVWLVCQVIVLI